MIKGFRDFIMRGNVIDLAVAVVIGAAFTSLINSVVRGLINPVIAAIFGKPDLSGVGNFTINNAQFSIGEILTALVNFLIIAAVIYFIVIVPMQALMARTRKPADEAAAAAAEPEDVVLLREIRDELRARR